MLNRSKKRSCQNKNWQEQDRGTPELQQKRQRLLKGGREHKTYLAESLLGVLYTRKLISKPLYKAGRFFGELGYRYELCLGHRFRRSESVLCLIKGQSLADPRFLRCKEKKQTKAWYQATKALKKSGPAPYQEVMKVVFYEFDHYTSPLPQQHINNIETLRQGLHYLDEYFKAGLKDKRRTRRGRGLSHWKSTTFQHSLKGHQPHSPP